MLKSVTFALVLLGLVGCAGSQSGTFTPTSATSAAGALAAPAATAPADLSSIPRSSVDALAATTRPGSNSYRIGPLDVLDISVFKVAELSQLAQVAETGTFNYPLVGEIKAGGRTASEVEKDLERRLGDKFLRNPQVTVLVKQYNSQRFTVDGAVKKPGVYPMRGQSTLMQAVAGAEGLTPTADNTLIIFRQNGNVQSVAKYNISDLRAGTVEDPVLQSNDIVMAPTSVVKEGMENLFKSAPLARVFTAL